MARFMQDSYIMMQIYSIYLESDDNNFCRRPIDTPYNLVFIRIIDFYGVYSLDPYTKAEEENGSEIM